MNRRSLFQSLVSLMVGSKAVPAAPLRISPPTAVDWELDAGTQAMLDRTLEQIRRLQSDTEERMRSHKEAARGWRVKRNSFLPPGGTDGQVLTMGEDGKLFWRNS